MNILPLEYCSFNSQNCSWVAAAATEKLECKNHNIRAFVSQKYAHFGRKNHNIPVSKFCTLLRSFCTLLRKFVHYTIYLKQE